MKHHVVFWYNDHAAHVASTTIETAALDFAPGTERWLVAVKGKCQAEVNQVVTVVSWQEFVEEPADRALERFYEEKVKP